MIYSNIGRINISWLPFNVRRRRKGAIRLNIKYLIHLLKLNKTHEISVFDLFDQTKNYLMNDRTILE